MRAPTIVAISALVLMGCGGGSTGTGAPPDSSTSDGVAAESGVRLDASADADASVSTIPDAAWIDGADDGGADSTVIGAPGDSGTSDGVAAESGSPPEDGPVDAPSWPDASDSSLDGSADADASANPPVDAAAADGAGDGAADTGPCADGGTWDGGFCCGAQRIPTPEGPNDCGRCGHRCGGGTCTSGVCQPFVVATLPQTFPGAYALAVNDTQAFVSGMNSDEDASVIYSAPLDGGGVQVFTHASDPPVELFADPSTLHWAGFESISSASIDGGGVTTLGVVDGGASIVGFGADPAGTTLYWGEISSTDDLTFWMDPADASAPTAIWDGGNVQCGGLDLTATSHDVYWTYQGNVAGPIPVFTAPLGSTAVTTLASLQDPARPIVQGNNLFVLALGSNGDLVQSIP
ncbi:MAG: hypothetical protein JOZ69_15330, partial [Myxococcales bacterium]|nr:hypothetical protein [Myxococcales bacterium]